MRFPLLSLLACSATASEAVIVNNLVRRDQRGQELIAQGGGVLFHEGRFVLVGPELRAAYNEQKKRIDYDGWAAVRMYSSPDLVTWTHVNDILLPGRDGAPAGGWVGRPMPLYHAASQRWVLVMENGGHITYADAPTLSGNYTWRGPIPLPGDAREPNDISAFTDGSDAYVVCTMAKGRSGRPVAIWKLRATDYGAVEAKIYESGPHGPPAYEAHHLLRRGTRWYWFASETRGWNSSRTWFRTADALAGPWTDFQVLATEPESPDSFNTQHDQVLTVTGSAGSTVLYIGDRWMQFTQKGIGRNVFLPLDWRNEQPVLLGLDRWRLDVSAGTWISAKP